MKNDTAELEKTIENVLASQRLAVLATEQNGQPYSSLMAFAHTPDLKTIVVATGRATRKHMNLMSESRISLLVDTRANSEEDFHAAVAVTIIGRASVVPESEQEELQELYLLRHPYLQSFLNSPSTVFFKIEVRHYLIVSRFQQVMELHMNNETNIFT